MNTNEVLRDGLEQIWTRKPFLTIDPASFTPREMLTRVQIRDGLRTLGVKDGDTLYIRAALGALGKIEGRLQETIVGGFRDAVGESGTLLAPAFTKIGNVFSSQKVIFESSSVPYSGAVSKIFLREPGAIRSSHPSHSFVGIGPAAKELLAGHGPTAGCFEPIKRLAEREGKMLLLGCNNDSPGFSTVHVAQFDLGLSQGHLVRHLQRAWIREDDGRLSQWKPLESPGCSASFDKFYPSYIRDENLVTGFVGPAYSLLVPSTRRALTTDKEILSRQPGFVDCGRASCLTCGFRSYQPWRIPRTLTAAFFQRLMR